MSNEKIRKILIDSRNSITEAKKLLKESRESRPSITESVSTNTLHGLTCDYCDEWLDPSGGCSKHGKS